MVIHYAGELSAHEIFSRFHAAESKANVEKPRRIVVEENLNEHYIKENLTPEAVTAFEELGLENLHIKTHTKEQLSHEALKAKIKDGNTNVYVLLHGWTGTSGMWDAVEVPPSNLTIVEQILSADPEAVIITPDGDGFGKSAFKDESIEELTKISGPEGYAKQIDFALKHYYGLDHNERDNVYAMGHSLGGATVGVMVGHGTLKAENCIEICPALLPTKEMMEKEEHSEEIQKVRDWYRFLGNLTKTAQMVKEFIPAAEGLTDALVDKVASLMLMAHLMGSKNPGSLSKEQFRSILAQLYDIHAPETPKKVTTAAMFALEKGVDIDPKTTELNLKEMAKVDQYTGEHDVLAPPMHAEITLKAKSITTLAEPDNNDEPEYDQGGLYLVGGAGHSSVVYEKGSNSPTAALLRKAKIKN